MKLIEVGPRQSEFNIAEQKRLARGGVAHLKPVPDDILPIGDKLTPDPFEPRTLVEMALARRGGLNAVIFERSAEFL